jgi:hypothetical protein
MTRGLAITQESAIIGASDSAQPMSAIGWLAACYTWIAS